LLWRGVGSSQFNVCSVQFLLISKPFVGLLCWAVWQSMVSLSTTQLWGGFAQGV
jgi:hypothetical protein